MAKKTITMKSLSQEVDLVFLDEQQEPDLSYWEFINQSDADDSDTESLISLENGFVSWYTLTPSSPAPPPPQSPNINQGIEAQVMIEDQYGYNDVNSCNDHVGFYGGYQPEAGSIIYHDDDDEEDYDDDDVDVDGYGLDDELVPWNVSGKLGRQRMRKLGKRVFSKMGSSKRNPYLHVKAGAVHGKHGLGLKA
ncbi:uncharacterized protein LOC8284345 [Ricinus communis]|uniref:uncharacterized protein LOC8284345 n=1 Tax=Ricinus communis TaxID=3988 RepID=UPI00201AE9F3|nr:uncharacterized protein LOC8284345 [Ricinus communis]